MVSLLCFLCLLWLIPLALEVLIGRTFLAIFRLNRNNAVSVYDLLVRAIGTGGRQAVYIGDSAAVRFRYNFHAVPTLAAPRRDSFDHPFIAAFRACLIFPNGLGS